MKSAGASTEYENATTGAQPIQGLHEYRKNVDAGRVLLAVGWDGVGSGTQPNGQNVFTDDATLLTDNAQITEGKNNVWTCLRGVITCFSAGSIPLFR